MNKKKWMMTFLVLSPLASAHNHHHEANINTQLVEPIAQHVEFNRDIAKLGWVLFNDPNLSSNQSISCQSCHDLSTNGAELTRVSTGVNGMGIRNSLTVFNTALNYRFFWDGRANSLEEQISGPITNPLEMDSNWQDIEYYVSQTDHYQLLFNAIDDFDINADNLRFALAEFMRSLQTPNSPFDRYLQGEKHALSTQAKRGWLTFQSVGCVQCHQGQNIGGSMIQKFGYFTATNAQEDTGRHLVTSTSQDKFYFRVASLRNVAKTPPYFHDGRSDTLNQAIRVMARGQLGITMDDSTVEDIEAFLQSLSAPRPSILKEFENE